MIVLHHLERSRSQRVLWLLEELKLPYRVVHYARAATMAAPDALKNVHPLGKAPIIEHEGAVVAETGAIFEYLVEVAGGRLGPPNERIARLRYSFCLHYAEGSILPALVKSTPENFALIAKPHLDFVEEELIQRDWLTGTRFTAIVTKSRAGRLPSPS